jgi:phage terminase small subunit
MVPAKRSVRKSRLQELRDNIGNVRRTAFAEWFAALGGKRHGADAARRAGFSDRGAAAKVRASEMLRDPDIRTYIIYLNESKMLNQLPQLTDHLIYLAFNAPESAVQLRATESAMNRSGAQLVERSQVEIEQHTEVEHRVSFADAAKRLSQLAGYDLTAIEYKEINPAAPEPSIASDPRSRTTPRRQGRSHARIAAFVPAPMSAKGKDEC